MLIQPPLQWILGTLSLRESSMGIALTTDLYLVLHLINPSTRMLMLLVSCNTGSCCVDCHANNAVDFYSGNAWFVCYLGYQLS